MPLCKLNTESSVWLKVMGAHIAQPRFLRKGDVWSGSQVAHDDGFSQWVVFCGRRYSLADVCPASLPAQGGSIGLDTSLELSKSHM